MQEMTPPTNTSRVLVLSRRVSRAANGAAKANGTATQAGAGFYLVTAQFLDKVYPLIEKGGFHFVDEWLVRWGCTS